jgi:hypothetical protein
MFDQLIKLEVDGRCRIVHPAVVAVAQRGDTFIIQVLTQEFQLSNIVPFRRILIHIIPSVSLNFGVDNTL